jgi:hypothetical protein
MMLLDCPGHLGEDGALRCGLPAEVRYRYTMRSTDGQRSQHTGVGVSAPWASPAHQGSMALR